MLVLFNIKLSFDKLIRSIYYYVFGILEHYSELTQSSPRALLYYYLCDYLAFSSSKYDLLSFLFMSNSGKCHKNVSDFRHLIIFNPF